MARIEGVDPQAVDRNIRIVFDAQEKNWGGPLLNHLVYARRPTIFRGVRGMWSGLDASGLIDPTLQALINRRVASLNRCEFDRTLTLPSAVTWELQMKRLMPWLTTQRAHSITTQSALRWSMPTA